MNNNEFNKILKDTIQDFVRTKENVEGLYQETMDAVEGRLITELFKRVNYNQSELTRITGLNRNTVRKRLKKYGLI